MGGIADARVGAVLLQFYTDYKEVMRCARCQQIQYSAMNGMRS